MAANKQGDQEIPLSTDQQTNQLRSEGIYQILWYSYKGFTGFINWDNIFVPPHCMYTGIVGGTRGNRSSSTPILLVSMYDGRNHIRFIPRRIGIYWKIPIIPIKINRGSWWFEEQYLTYHSTEILLDLDQSWKSAILRQILKKISQI